MGSRQPEAGRAGDAASHDFWLGHGLIHVEEFGTQRVARLTPEEINQRFRTFKQMTHFEEIPFQRANSDV